MVGGEGESIQTVREGRLGSPTSAKNAGEKERTESEERKSSKEVFFLSYLPSLPQQGTLTVSHGEGTSGAAAGETQEGQRMIHREGGAGEGIRLWGGEVPFSRLPRGGQEGAGSD